MKHSLIVFALTLVACYLLASFLFWSFNPGHWQFMDRATAVFVAVSAALALATANYK